MKYIYIYVFSWPSPHCSRRVWCVSASCIRVYQSKKYELFPTSHVGILMASNVRIYIYMYTYMYICIYS